MENKSFKVCSKCNLEKEIEFFYADKRLKDGHRSCCKLCDKKWPSSNKNIVKLRSRDWYLKNKNRKNSTVKKWKELNTEKFKEDQKKWVLNNKEKLKAKRLTPKEKLRNSMSCAIRHSLKGKKDGKCWALLIDYSIEKLKIHLEKQFTPEMTWDNYGTYWHIDHKIPVAAFNFETYDDIDFKRCWAITNLQPLPAKENMSKGAKLYKPFQPSLLLRCSNG